MILTWELHWEGAVWRGDDMTIGEILKVEAETGKSWMNLDIVSSLPTLSAIIEILAESRNGVAREHTAAKVALIKMKDIFNVVKSAEDDLPTSYSDGNPQTADDSSTAI
jgi:hypothetical protein